MTDNIPTPTNDEIDAIMSAEEEAEAERYAAESEGKRYNSVQAVQERIGELTGKKPVAAQPATPVAQPLPEKVVDPDPLMLAKVDDSAPGMKMMQPMQLAKLMQAYRSIQKVIDDAMPDAIMTINEGKKNEQKFRKKAYWRAVEMAFALRVECVSERQIKFEDDWGYEVVYRAYKPNGTYTDGDGSCMASEKNAYVWQYDKEQGRRVKTDQLDEVKTKQNTTVHNVRSHAHTRAFNRAVSNCVGFGEVSAEEIQ